MPLKASTPTITRRSSKMNSTHVHYIIACHESNDLPNIGFIVPERTLEARKGWYPQRRSLGAWLNRGLTYTPEKWCGGSWYFTTATRTTLLTSLETLESLNGTEWVTVQCKNVFNFFGLIGYNYKKKRYEYPLDPISLLGYNPYI